MFSLPARPRSSSLALPGSKPSSRAALRYSERRACKSATNSSRRGRQVMVACLRGRRQLPLVVGRLCRVAGPAQQGELGRLDRAGEDAIKRVVVFGGNRVELVVMAASTGDGQAQQSTGDDVDPVVDDLVLIEQEAPADGQETQSGQRPVVAAARELIGRDLLDEELVVTEVGVERGDHVIAVGVGVGVAAILREDVTLGVGVAGDVEPVPAPTLAIPWRSQQTIDQPVECVGAVVRLERVDLLGRRRDAPQVDRCAANQGSLVRLGVTGSSRRPRAGPRRRHRRAFEPIPRSLTVGGAARRTG